MTQKLPVGIQSFESIRTGGYLYADKTAYIYKLVHEGIPYFLSRPRRFGKSLLVSTLKAYWEGKKELFEGLVIERLEADNEDAWQPRPVFHFDFNETDYEQADSLEGRLDMLLREYEEQWGIAPTSDSFGGRFRHLLGLAHKQTGHRCVVLIDEYDKPLLDTMHLPELENRNRGVLKGFYSVLKGSDEHLRFVLLTGVTKFSKVSIFSDLNQLRDISYVKDYAGICGITEEELQDVFGASIRQLAESQEITVEACHDELRAMYDGYRFHQNGPDVYNPFSLLNAFASGEFGSYWFESGSPTFLVRKLHDSGFDPSSLTDGKLWASEAQLSDYRIDNPNLVPLLYQTGYLTIQSFDNRRRRYTLTVPNGEVKYGLLESLAPAYAPAATGGTGTDVYALDDYLESGDLEGVRKVLTALFASIPYTQESDPFEHYFQAVIYIVFTMLGRFVQCELRTATGRVDCVLATDDYVYLFEFKRDGTTDEALAQIDEKGYALPFAADPRPLYRIGVVFDSDTRLLSGWEVRE